MEQTAQQISGRRLAKDVSQKLSARRAAVENLKTAELTDRRLLTQQALLAAGRTLIAERGVAGTSVGDLTKAAGFTRGAFYSNFADMDQFVAEVARIEWDSMYADVQDILDSWTFTAHDPIEGATRILLAALPRERERYLLWNEFAIFEIRFPKESGVLSKNSKEFYAGLVQLLDLILETFELEPRHSTTDLVELIVSLSQRSLRNEIVSGEDVKDTLLTRLLPDIIRSMTYQRNHLVENNDT